MKRMLVVALAVVMVTLSALATAQGRWRGGLGSMGEAMEDSGRLMLESALQEERQRRLMQQQFEQDRQLMEQRIQQQRAFLEQQGQARQIISTQQQMIEERDRQIQTQNRRITELLENQKRTLPLIEELRVYRKYPTWAQTVKTREFDGWLKRQPSDVQTLADSDRADDAIRMLGAYHADAQKRKK